MCLNEIASWLSLLSGGLGLAGSIIMALPEKRDTEHQIRSQELRNANVGDDGFRAKLGDLADDVDNIHARRLPERFETFKTGFKFLAGAFTLLLVSAGLRIAAGG